MSESAPSTQTRNGANGAKSEGAIDTRAALALIESTPDDSSTVQSENGGKPKQEDKKTPKSQQSSDDGDDESEDEENAEGNESDNSDDSEEGDNDADGENEADELKHSDATLQAEIEKAKRTSLDEYRKEDKAARTKRAGEINSLIKANRSDTPPILRAVQNQLDALPALEEGTKYTSDDFDPVIKTVRDALSLAQEAAEVVVGEIYEAEINSLFSTDEARKAFWTEAEGLDPSLHVNATLKLLIDHLALTTDAVGKADPQKLIESNADLKAYISTEKDKSFKAGRARGRKDPDPERRGSEQTSSTRAGEYPKDADGKIDTRKVLASFN